jgi:xylose isomerase
MRTYNILKEKARRFEEDPEIQGILQEVQGRNPEFERHLGDYSPQKARALKRVRFDIDRMGAQGLGYERLDQLLAELLFGVR